MGLTDESLASVFRNRRLLVARAEQSHGHPLPCARTTAPVRAPFPNIATLSLWGKILVTLGSEFLREGV